MKIKFEIMQNKLKINKINKINTAERVKKILFILLLKNLKKNRFVSYYAQIYLLT